MQRLRPESGVSGHPVEVAARTVSVKAFRCRPNWDSGAGTWAGVGKPSGNEPARNGGKRVPRALWGFQRRVVIARSKRAGARTAGRAGEGRGLGERLRWALRLAGE